MRPHVYALAFACEPNRGSEPGVGYAFAEALARLANVGDYDITLLTRTHRLDNIAASIRESVGETLLEIRGVPLPGLLVKLTGRKHVRLAYLVWQFLTMQFVKTQILAEKRFAIVHHLTFATEAIPTFEWRVPPGTARIFGPAGSSQTLNKAVEGGPWPSFRSAMRRYFGRQNLKNVTLAVAQNHAAACQFRQLGATAIVVEPNVVVDIRNVASLKERGDLAYFDRPDLISVGMLVDLKRHHMAIEALTILPDNLKLTIVGDGPLLGELRNRARELGLTDRVRFTGMKRRDEALYLISQSRVLVHSSRQEGAGWVVGEAQSVGTTPVAFKGSGADSLIMITNFGRIAHEDTVESLAAAISDALTVEGTPVGRWDSGRLPETIASWYQQTIPLGLS